MSDTHLRDEAFINSIIGEGTRFKGEFELNGLLRIDGDFTGSIRTNGKVLVGRNGRAECTMHAGTVVIGGVMRGEIFSSEKVIVLSTGLMLGNITSPRLIVEEGVIIHGTCTINPAPQAAAQGHGGPKAGASMDGQATAQGHGGPAREERAGQTAGAPAQKKEPAPQGAPQQTAAPQGAARPASGSVSSASPVSQAQASPAQGPKPENNGAPQPAAQGQTASNASSTQGATGQPSAAQPVQGTAGSPQRR